MARSRRAAGHPLSAGHEVAGARPVAARTGFVDVAGRRIRHRVLGRGADAVVLVHGFGGRLENWAANQAALASGGREVAALDLPGHGESGADVGSGSLDELAASVLAYMDAVGIHRAHLVGHSMGAAACLVVADRLTDALDFFLGEGEFGQDLSCGQRSGPGMVFLIAADVV